MVLKWWKVNLRRREPCNWRESVVSTENFSLWETRELMDGGYLWRSMWILCMTSSLSSHSTSATAVSSPKCNSEKRPLSNSVAFQTLFKWHRYCGILKIHIVRKINTGIRYEPVYRPALPPVGRVCTEFPSPEQHGSNPVPVHARLTTPALPVDGRAIRDSSCRPLVPSERESVGLSPHPPPMGSAETQGLCGCPTRSHSPLPPWRPGVVVHPRHMTPPALQEAKSPLHWSVQDPEADQWGYLLAPTSPQVSYPSHIPRFPT